MERGTNHLGQRTRNAGIDVEPSRQLGQGFGPDTSPLSCPNFGTCGGCVSLTTPYAPQREALRQRVEEQLGPWLPRDGPPVSFTDRPAAPPRHDRTRILYPVQPHPQLGLTMGLFRRGTHTPVEIDACELQHPALTELGARALPVLRRSGLRPYDETRHTGQVRAFSARLAPSTGELLLGIVTAEPRLDGAEALATALLAAASGLPDAGGPAIVPVGLVHNIQTRRGNALVGAESHALSGRMTLQACSDGLLLRIGFASFYQLHRAVDRLLYDPAMQMLGDLQGARVIDGYGGVGCFALRAARAGAARVMLVEASRSACDDARHNAAHNELSVDVVEGAFSADTCSELAADVLVVDPSRAGLGEVGCSAVRSVAAPRVLYASCGLPALRRDLERLPEYGVAEVRLADLFPHTGHVETLVLLHRRSGGFPPC
ncbi:MAG: class I SAM-dependent RNA methyltransferase [Planctomycetes bacterium]|nr:class I SAM-dependent RNA methyltransferase [Planctomycetota bacterium]